MMSSSGFMLTMAVAACVLMLGGILAMLYLRQRSQVSAGSQGELEKELREQLASARNTVEELRQQLDTERSGKTQAEARLEAAETYRKEQDRLHEKHLIDLKADHTKALEELKESFRALSHEALKETHPVFLQLAKESFAGLQATAKGDLASRQESIAALVKPLEDQLKQYQKVLADNEQNRSKSLGELKQQLEH
ncbi:MAG: hypothetical protein ACO3PR_07525, partial [Limisphaerales bacterium]